jgi:LysR family transcriptional regulator, glycine cleavage system transcriptional activator
MLILLTNTKSTAKKRLAFWSIQGWPAGQIALRFECSQSFGIFKVKCIKSKGAKVSHLNALRAFEAAARHQSFSAAAFELDVTPAAVSQLIKGVEHSLGVTLFNRAKGRSGKITLTTAGELAYPDINAGFKLIQSGLNSLRRITDETQLSIAVSPAFASKWLIPRLGDFRSKHPNIEILK